LCVLKPTSAVAATGLCIIKHYGSVIYGSV